MDRPGVEALLHLHDRHAGLAIAGQHRALDRRRAAPARQQRGVDVDAAEPRDLEDLPRQDPPVGGDHDDVEVVLAQLGRERPVADLERLQHRHAERRRGLLDRRRHQLAPAPRRPVGLADHHPQVTGLGDRLQARHGEFGGSHEGGAQGHQSPRCAR
jgi:hypothetical protein